MIDKIVFDPILGNDWLLDDNGDLIIGLNGDYMTTTDKEILDKLNPFAGYQTILITLARLVYYAAGEYSPYDILFGAGATNLISTNFNETFNNFATLCSERILEDDRFKRVDSITYEKITNDFYKIIIKVAVVGSNQIVTATIPIQ